MSFLTAAVAVFAVCVTSYFAWHTRELAKKKLQLDLYDRRFKIFSSIFDFYEAMISWKGTPEQKKARDTFFRASHEAAFLFTKESCIEALLKNLNDEGNKVIGFKENSDSYKGDAHLMVEQLKKTTDIQTRVFEEGLAKLRAAMHPYLDFSKVL